MKLSKLYLETLIMILSLSGCLYSQNKLYTLVVIIKNPLNQRIPNSQIKLINPDKQKKQVISDKLGAGNFAKLSSGQYSIIVNAKGFKEFKGEPIIGGNNDVIALEIKLEIAAIESSVEIDPNQTVDKENYGGSRTVITQEEIKNLPDDPVEFERAIRQILGQSITGDDLGITVNGIPKTNLPPKEAIQQIKVDQDIFSAKNSGVGGQGIQVTTKAGMTKFEGNFAFGFSDSRLDARNPFIGRRVPYQNKGYKFNLTGPLTKRSSFILSLSRNQRDSSVPINAVILNSNLKAETFQQTFPLPRLSNSLELSINYDPTDQQKLFFNYVFQISQAKGGVGGFNLPESLTKNTNQSHSFSISHQYLPNANLTSKTILSLDYSKSNSVAKSSKPLVIVLDAFSSGSAVNNGSNLSYKVLFSNDTERQIGKNNLQYGFEIIAEKLIVISKINFNGTYLFTGKTAPMLDAVNNPLLDSFGNIITEQINSIESYRRNVLFHRQGFLNSQIRQLGGSPDQYSISTGNPKLSVSQIDYAFYLQNNYKLSETFGIGTGIRYENQTNINSRFNISPRLSFIWSPKAKEKKNFLWSLPKISSGGGIYFTNFGIENTLNEKQLNSEDRFSYFISNSPVLDVFPNIPSTNFLENTSQARSLTFINPNINNPLQATLNLNINKNITKQFLINFSYTHSGVYRSMVTRNINAPLAGTYNYLNPNLSIYPSGTGGYINEINSIGKSISDRFILSPRLPRFKILKYTGFLNFNYIFTKGKSNAVSGSGSPIDPYDFRREYSPTISDGIHSLNLVYFQNLPLNSRVSLMYSIRSGSRFNIITGQDTNGDGYYLERPAFASNIKKSGVIFTKYGYLDPNPTIGDIIIPRNLGRGTAAADSSLSFNKIFEFNKDPKTKKSKQQFTINFSISNLFNITNKGIPIGNMSSPNFLKFLNNSTEFNSSYYSNQRSLNVGLNFSF